MHEARARWPYGDDELHIEDTRLGRRTISPTSGEATEARRSRSRSRTPKVPVTPLRCMIIEESSSSSDGCPAKQTVSALRKRLDEQPPPPPPPALSQLHPPPLLISPAPLAEASTYFGGLWFRVSWIATFRIPSLVLNGTD